MLIQMSPPLCFKQSSEEIIINVDCQLLHDENGNYCSWVDVYCFVWSTSTPPYNYLKLWVVWLIQVAY